MKQQFAYSWKLEFHFNYLKLITTIENSINCEPKWDFWETLLNLIDTDYILYNAAKQHIYYVTVQSEKVNGENVCMEHGFCTVFVYWVLVLHYYNWICVNRSILKIYSSIHTHFFMLKFVFFVFLFLYF